MAKKDETRVVHAGRHPEEYHGIVNPPVYHTSTVISPNLADWEQKDRVRVKGAACSGLAFLA